MIPVGILIGALPGLLIVKRCAGINFFILPNVKEHATLSAGASVDHGV
jgi:hypothetical protein